MKHLRLQLLVIALLMFAANSVFADTFFSASIDTSSLNGDTGFLYFQFIPVNAADSTTIVSGFTGGQLMEHASLEVMDGSAVSGELPGPVTFHNTNGINDYNHGITFGDSLRFLLTFSEPASGGALDGSSSFSLGFFGDEFGAMPLLTADGTLFTASLMNSGAPSIEIFASEAVVTPEASTMWLLGSGLFGLLFAIKAKRG